MSSAIDCPPSCWDGNDRDSQSMTMMMTKQVCLKSLIFCSSSSFVGGTGLWTCMRDLLLLWRSRETLHPLPFDATLHGILSCCSSLALHTKYEEESCARNCVWNVFHSDFRKKSCSRTWLSILCLLWWRRWQSRGSSSEKTSPPTWLKKKGKRCVKECNFFLLFVRDCSSSRLPFATFNILRAFFASCPWWKCTKSRRRRTSLPGHGILAFFRCLPMCPFQECWCQAVWSSLWEKEALLSICLTDPPCFVFQTLEKKVQFLVDMLDIFAGKSRRTLLGYRVLNPSRDALAE